MINKIRGVLAGPSECGKTTLAKAIARRDWIAHKRITICYDPHLLRREVGGTWGPSVAATPDFSEFEKLVWNLAGATVIMDEGTTAIDRDQSMTRYFTEIRHRHPAFYVMAHDASVLLPIMRQSLTEGFIFRQTADAARKWEEVFVDEDLRQATELGQFEYLHKRPFRAVERRRPTMEELDAGRI